MSQIKKIILYEEEVCGVGFKLVGMQLCAGQDKVIECFGVVAGDIKVVSLEENEFLVGVKAKEEVEMLFGYIQVMTYYNVQFKILRIPNGAV